MNRKNVWLLQEARALVIDMCAGQLEQPNIPAATIVVTLLRKYPINSFNSFTAELFLDFMFNIVLPAQVDGGAS